MATYAEQVKDLENTIAARKTRMDEIMKAAADEGRSTDDAEGEEFDTLSADIKKMNADLARIKQMESFNASKAEPVEGNSTKAAGDSRSFATVKNTQKLEPGIEFARYAMCLGAAKGDMHTAFSIAKKRFPETERVVNTLKEAVDAGTTTDITWAAPLVEYNQFAGDFVEFLRPQTIVGRMSPRRIPFNVNIRGQTSGGSGYWVGEGAPKPLTSFDYDNFYLGFTKVAGIAVLTDELVRFSNPSAEALVRQSLADAVIETIDTSFIDPAFAGGASAPASITNGVTPIPATGTDADAVRCDIAALWEAADAANLPSSGAVYVTDSRTARRLSLMTEPLGNRAFPDVTMSGGSLGGIPLVVSNYVPSDSTGSMFVLAFQSEIWMADDGVVTLDASREASLQMLTNPTNNSATSTPAEMVSMFQTNSVALRAERYINWKKRRSEAVAYLTGVNWGACAS